MISQLVSFDKTLTLILQNLFPHNLFFSALFSFLSLQGITVFLWFGIVLAAIIFEERKNPGISARDKKFILSFTLSLLITGLLVNVILKNTIHRPRPTTSNWELEIRNLNYNCPKDFSFPSGHASLSFAAATVLASFDKKRKWFYYTIAALISYSRIYLGCHYFLDILFGAVLGYLISKYIIKFLKHNLSFK